MNEGKSFSSAIWCGFMSLSGLVGVVVLVFSHGAQIGVVALIGLVFTLFLSLLLRNSNCKTIVPMVSVYMWCVAAIAVASCYRLSGGDLFQIESDPYGFYLRTEDATQNINLGSLVENQYEMRSATAFWIIFNRFVGLFGISYSQEVGAFVNAMVAALCSGVGMRIVALWMSGKSRIESESSQNKLVVWFSLCGLMVSVTSILLRDIFGCLYLSIFVWAVSSWQLRPPGTGARTFGFIVMLAVFGFSSFMLNLLRPEMVILPCLYLVCVFASRRSRGALIVILLVGGLAVALLAGLFFGAGVIEMMSSRAGSYNELATDLSSGFSRMIYGAPIYVKVILGPWYLSMYPVPFYAPMLSSDSYGLFRGLQVFWSAVATPVLIGAAFTAFSSRGFFLMKSNKGFDSGDAVFRASLMFLVILFMMTGVTSVEARHLIPAILVWCAIASVSNWSNNHFIRRFVFLWVFMVVGVNLAWFVVKL